MHYPKSITLAALMAISAVSPALAGSVSEGTNFPQLPQQPQEQPQKPQKPQGHPSSHPAPKDSSKTPKSVSSSQDVSSNSEAVNVAAPVVNQSNENTQVNNQTNHSYGSFQGEQAYSQVEGAKCASTMLYGQANGGLTDTGGTFGFNQSNWSFSAGIVKPLGQGNCKEYQRLAAERYQTETQFKVRKYCVEVVSMNIVDPICEEMGIRKATPAPAPVIPQLPLELPEKPSEVPPSAIPGMW